MGSNVEGGCRAAVAGRCCSHWWKPTLAILVASLGVRQAPAVRGEHWIGHRLGPARWQGMGRPLVPAWGRRRHQVHHRVRPTDDLRPRTGLDRTCLPV